MAQIIIDFPDNILQSLQDHPEKFIQEVRLATALYYFSDKRLSLGQAARLAGVSISEMLDILAVRNIPVFDLDTIDAIEEIKAARRVF